jgi:hypothetical protein
MPDSFTAVYTLHGKGMKLGEMERSFTALGDGNYRFLSESKTTGFISFFRDDHIVEESIWQFDQQGFKPQTYSYDHTGGKKDRHVRVIFDYENGSISNQLADDSWEMPLQEHVLDKLLYQLVIMSDLKRNETNLNYTIADGGHIKEYEMELLGEEMIDTPLGRIRTVKLQRHKPNSKRSTTLWCASELHYLPVRVEYLEKDGEITTAEIKQVSGLGRPGDE